MGHFTNEMKFFLLWITDACKIPDALKSVLMTFLYAAAESPDKTWPFFNVILAIGFTSA